MITLMHSSRSRPVTDVDAEILARIGENRRAAYAAADRRDAQMMFARSDATGERSDEGTDTARTGAAG